MGAKIKNLWACIASGISWQKSDRQYIQKRNELVNKTIDKINGAQYPADITSAALDLCDQIIALDEEYEQTSR